MSKRAADFALSKVGQGYIYGAKGQTCSAAFRRQQAAQYPLTRCDCDQVTACGIRTRTKYSTVVSTTGTGGTFRLLGRPACAPNNALASINGTAPTNANGGYGAAACCVIY